MDKKGVVYRELVESTLKHRRQMFVERELSRRLAVSPDTVNRALRPLKEIGAAGVLRRGFQVIDFEKLLAYWAVGRKFARDVVYSTFIEVKSMAQIENRMPSGIAFTCFSGYVKMFGDAPADYGWVHVYATEDALGEIRSRFPERDLSRRAQGHNLFVLKPDKVIEGMMAKDELARSSAPISQIYVDLWNNNTWNAYEFLKSLKKKIDDMYGKAVLEQ